MVTRNEQKQGRQVDLLNGNIFLSMLIFAVPILFSNLFQQLYNTMDTVIVGNILGETSLAAIGAATPVYDLMIGFALGVGNGLSIVTARSFGSKDMELLKRSVAVSIVIGAGISLVLTAGSRWFLLPFLKLLHTPAEILEESYHYISMITLFTFVMFAYNLCAGILRAVGNSFMPLVFLAFSSVLNIGLDFFFISYVHLGVRGAAVATVLSQGVSVLLCIVYIHRHAKLLVPGKEHFVPDRALYLEMAAQGFSMGFMGCIVSAGSAILQVGINGLGFMVIAGHTAARKIYQFGLMPFVAMVMAAGTFVSQNYGADQAQRVRKAMKYAYLYNAFLTVALMAVFGLFAPALVQMVSGSKEQVVIANGTRYLRVVAPAYFILGLVNDTRTALQSIGQKLLPIVSSFIELLGKIMFVLLLIPKYQYNAVIFCEPVIWCFMAAQLLAVFWRHPWIKGKSDQP